MKKKHPLLLKVILIYLVTLSIVQLSAGFIEDLIFPIYVHIFFGIGFFSLFLAFWLQMWEKKNDSERIYLLCITFLRYSLAFSIGTYGVAKLLDIQFQQAEYIRDMPIGRLSGISLTWYYFSYSRPLAYIIGSIQCISAFLFVFRRTELVGALLLLPVIVNIALINLFYDIHYGAMVNSILFTAICLYIIYIHSEWIISGIKQFYQETPGLISSTSKIAVIGKWTIRFIVIAGSWLFMVLVVRYYAPPPGKFRGAWDLTEQYINGTDQKIPIDTILRRIYFNDGDWATWKKGEQFYNSTFSLDEETNFIYLKLRNRSDSLMGRYQLQDSLLTVTGMRNTDSVKYVFKLSRK